MKKQKRKIGYSNAALILIGIILIIGAIASSIDSSELDEVCNTNDRFLYRFQGLWGCGNINTSGMNITINQNINITNTTIYALNEEDPIFTQENQTIWNAINNMETGNGNVTSLGGNTDNVAFLPLFQNSTTLNNSWVRQTYNLSGYADQMTGNKVDVDSNLHVHGGILSEGGSGIGITGSNNVFFNNGGDNGLDVLSYQGGTYSSCINLGYGIPYWYAGILQVYRTRLCDDSDRAGSIPYANPGFRILNGITNTEWMRIQPTGRVGINNPYPQAMLEITKNNESQLQLSYNDSRVSTFFTDVSGNLQIYNTTNTMLNFATAGGGLYIKSTVANTAALYFETNSKAGQFSLDSSGNMVFRQSTSGSMFFDYIGGLSFRNQTGDTNLKILTNGNVGIGTLVPASKLEVNGTSGIKSNTYLLSQSAVANNQTIYVNNSGTAMGFQWNYVDLPGHTASAVNDTIFQFTLNGANLFYCRAVDGSCYMSGQLQSAAGSFNSPSGTTLTLAGGGYNTGTGAQNGIKMTTAAVGSLSSGNFNLVQMYNNMSTFTDNRSWNGLLINITDIGNSTGKKNLIVADYNFQRKFAVDSSGQINSSTTLQPIILNGDATVWEDLQVPLETAKLGATSKPDFDYTNLGYLFPQNDATEKLYIIAQLPHKYKEGSNICPHIHWDMTSTTIPTWKINYTWYNNGDNSTRTWTTITTNSTSYTYTSGRQEQISNWTCITGTNMNISSVFKAILWREDNTVTGDVLADSFDIHYESDTLGSASEYNKWS